MTMILVSAIDMYPHLSVNINFTKPIVPFFSFNNLEGLRFFCLSSGTSVIQNFKFQSIDCNSEKSNFSVNFQ